MERSQKVNKIVLLTIHQTSPPEDQFVIVDI
jgi:hypothetical protein